MNAIPELAEGRLYDLLESAGQQVRNSARLLAQGAEEGSLNATTCAESLSASSNVVEEIRAHLLRADMVSLPKADLENLCGVLAAIPSDAARFAERFGLAAKDVDSRVLRPALGWVEELSEIVLDMVRQLRGFESLDRLKELNARLLKVAEHAEAQADEIVTAGYKAPTTAMHLMMAKDLSDQLGAIIERYRAAGKIMAKISFEFF